MLIVHIYRTQILDVLTFNDVYLHVTKLKQLLYDMPLRSYISYICNHFQSFIISDISDYLQKIFSDIFIIY